MKHLSLNSALIALMLFSCLNSFAGRDGGGGGGFTVGGQYYTWDEAGVKLSKDTESTEYILTREQIQALRDYTKSLPYGKSLYGIAIGDDNYFKKAQSVDRRTVRKIKEEYRKCFDKDSFNKFDGNFVLYAISGRKETLLFPEFFKLNPIQQSKILIHEGNVRAKSFSCEVLEIDQAIANAHDISQTKDQRRLAEVDLYPLLKTLALVSWGIHPTITNGLFSYETNAILADIYNRGLEIPINLVLPADDIEYIEMGHDAYILKNPPKHSCLDKKFSYKEKSDCIRTRFLRDLVQSEYIDGKRNTFRRENILELAADHYELYELLKVFKSVSLTAIRKDEKVQLDAKLCKDKEMNKLFVTNLTEESDFWNLKIRTFIARCMNENGNVYARPELEIVGFSEQ